MKRGRPDAFSLVELLVAMSITAMLVVLLANIAGSVSGVWRQGSAQAESHSTARGALSLIGRELEGAVIDLDIGFQIDPKAGEPGNFVLKFLRRRDPGSAGAIIEKTAYQLAWASRGLLPEVRGSYDAEHAVPVLIRRTSSDLADVYHVSTAGGVSAWAANWGTLGPTDVVQTKVPEPDGTLTEVAAENVLGWQVIPKYWAGGGIESDDPDHPVYYGRYLTSDKAPRALEIRLAVVPSPSVPVMSSFAEQWGGVRERADLFGNTGFPGEGFDRHLRTNLRHFAAVVYLPSRTP